MKQTVFLTGGTGNMGWAGFQEIYKKKDRFNIRLLARPSRKNKRLLAKYKDDPSVTVIWGDLTSYEDVLEATKGSDIVLHVGGMVSPAADYFPEQTLRVNVLATEHVVKAALAQPNKDEIKVVYIGSVAEYGCRMEDIRWGRTGDPMRASSFDMYSVSKCKAEKILIDSGLKNWVVLRQTGILYPELMSVVNPTVFHVPLRGMLEWVTIEDSGRLLGNIIEPSVPSEFWNRVYNVSSGEEYRMTNYEFEVKLLEFVNLPAPEKIFEPQWFATQNFHGMWYTDADILEEYLHFRENVPIDEYFKRLTSKLPWFYSLIFLVPSPPIKWFMKALAYEKGMGTQNWVKHNREKFLAYYGSEENYKSIQTWEDIVPEYMEKNLEKAFANGDVLVLDHGYDESKSIYELSLEEVQAAAKFRGGKFIGIAKVSDKQVCNGHKPVKNQTSSNQDGVVTGENVVAGENVVTEDYVVTGDSIVTENCVVTGEKGTIYEWECEHGHRFTASLEFVLLAGGWCTHCDLDKFETHITAVNKFSSQIMK